MPDSPITFQILDRLTTAEQYAERDRVDIAELKRQVQLLQGHSGLLEPLSLISGWQESNPATTPVTGSFVGMGQVLLAGTGVTFTKPANSPFLRIQASGGMNADYIVSADGTGTHTSLMAATTGALDVAIATGVSKTIWICTSHTETVSARHNITLANNQVITIISGGGKARPTLTIGHANAVLRWTGTAGSSSRLVMKGFRWYRTAANAGHFSDFGAGTDQMSECWMEDMIFNGDTANGTWGHYVDGRTQTGTLGSMYWRFVTYIGLAASGSAHLSSIGATATNSQFATYCDIADCDLQLTNLEYHINTTTDADLAQRMTFNNNRMTIVATTTLYTGVAMRFGSTVVDGANGRGFQFNNNNIIHKGNVDFIMNDGLTGSSKIAEDIEIVGNYYNASIAGGGGSTTFVNLTNTAGTTRNVTIMGNTLIGPGSGNAINFNGAAATASQIGLNAFRNWSNNTSGTGAMTTIFGPLTVSGASGSSFAFVTTFTGNADALTDNAGVYLNTTGTEWMSLGFRRSSATKAVLGIWDTTAPSTFAANDFYFTTYDGAYHDMMALANDGTKIKLNQPLNSVSYGYFGSTAFANPTNTTAGDLTATRVKVGNGAFGSGVEFSVTGDGALSGFLRVGSETAPNNTTAGDLTASRFNIGNTAFTSGVEAQIEGDGILKGYLKVSTDLTAPTNTSAGDLDVQRLTINTTGAFGTNGYFLRVGGSMTDTANGAVAAYQFGPTIAPASNSLSDFRVLFFQGIIAPPTTVTLDTIQSGRFENRWRSDATATLVTGLYVDPILIDSSSPAAWGNPGTVRGLHVEALQSLDTSKTGSITTVYGIDVDLLQAGGTSFTITTGTSIHIKNASSAPTSLTTYIGLDIENLTRGTNNIGIRNASTTVKTPTSQTLAAAGNTITVTASLANIDNSTGASLTLTSTPTVSTTGAQSGQFLTIVNVDSADNIVLQDETSLAGSKLRLPGAANLTLGPKDSVTLVYNTAAGEWWAVAASNN